MQLQIPLVILASRNVTLTYIKDLIVLIEIKKRR